MSLGFDNAEPNQNGASYTYNTVTNGLPPAGSQVTIVRDPQPEPDLRQRQPGLATSSSMNSIPHAPSPPEAPTYRSHTSEDEAYGADRYAGHGTDFPEYASSTPRPPPSAHINPTSFMMRGMQTDALVHRDFKDELTRAAGTVTPGVSDVPYIRYAIDALTRQQKQDAANVYGNGNGNGTYPDSDEWRVPRTQIVPQFGVRVSRSPPIEQPLTPIHRDEDSVRNEPLLAGWQTSLPVRHDEESIRDEPTSDGWESPLPVRRDEEEEEEEDGFRRDEPMSDGWQTPLSIPVTPATAAEQRTPIHTQQPAAARRHPEQAHIDEIPANFYRTETPVEQDIPAPTSNFSPPRTLDVWRAQSDSFSQHDLKIPGRQDPSGPPPLTHKPWILRPASLVLLGTLCALVTAALVFSAVYAAGHDGFVAYAGTIYGGQYFVFRVLPQLAGAVVLVHAQAVAAAVSRVYPLSAMASDDRRERRHAVFLPLYPGASSLWPRLVGPWQVWAPTLVIWLAGLATVPLLSGLYTVVLVDGVWTWSAVQGVAWTLVAVYVALLASTVVLFVYWHRRRTGMAPAWDVRSIADVAFLLAQSSSLPRYRGLETAASRAAMERALDGTAERLGYWTTPEAPENPVFWGFGVPTTGDDLVQEKWEKNSWAARRRGDGSFRPVTLSDAEDQKEPWEVRFRYLPWCFRDSQIILFVVAAAVLLIALVVVSFLPATDIRKGFLPGLSAAPLEGAFSPADFLYSFLPSFLGVVLFLGFQSLDLTLRVLTPWGQLSREQGSRAETSLLLDYAACLPWGATVKAVRLGHWRVAFVSFMSPLFALIPVLAGGLFMALTPPSGVVRVYPNVAILAVLLALLFLYLAALASLVPARRQFRLPHAVTCLAEIMSFCCSEQIRADPAFDRAHITTAAGRADLERALDCGKDRQRQALWAFGAGRSDDERLGIKRLTKFTTINPTKLRHYDKHVRGKPISAPLPHGNGPLFNHY